jgi:hypothetical protein
VIEHDVVQLSPDWWELRRGRPTASDFDRILSPVKELPSKSRDKYMGELLWSCTPKFSPNAMTEQPSNPAMRHGVDCEPEARAFYEMAFGRTVRQVGLCTTDCGRIGMSPDGLVDVRDGYAIGLEIKCPQPETHRKYLEKGMLPREYRCQVHGQLVVGEGQLTRIDFLSYCRGQDPLLVPVYPDDFTAKLKAALEEFWRDYAEVLSATFGVPVGGWADVESIIRRRS